MKYQSNPPSAASLLSSLRDIGYNIETAIEDLIDNSITAESTLIKIRMIWNEGQPWVAILDNGKGMSSSELIQAMKLGSMSPLEERDKDDLGRFGLGLKTASFSQCKQLTVVTFNKGQISSAEMDLDEIIKNNDKGFRVGILDRKDIENIEQIREYFSEQKIN